MNKQIFNIAIAAYFFMELALNPTSANAINKENIIEFIPSCCGIQSIPMHDDKPHHELAPGVVYKNEREALDYDIGLLAEELGISFEEVEQSVAFQEAFYKYADKIRATYSDQISGVWVEPVPATVGRIRFIDKVPLEISSVVKKNRQNDQIILTGGGKVREKDHPDRTLFVCETLKEMNMTNFICSSNVSKDRVDIEINVAEKAGIPNQENIIKEVQKRANKSQLKGLSAIFRPGDIELKIKITTDPIATQKFHRGGMTAFNPNNNSNFINCTTAWSVLGAFGDGLITAGHCNQPAGGLGSYHLNHYGITRITFVNGWAGDAAYYDINPDRPASPDFYADAFQVRTTRGIKLVDNMLGEPVCRYGRVSNFRSCNHTVTSEFACYYISGNLTFGLGGYWICGVVRATNGDSVPGDSGGGWSWGERAWGVHSASAEGTNALFMPVERIQNILGVYVKRIVF